MISAYSFAMSVTLFNISLTVVYMLRRKKDFIAKYGIQTLMLITLLGWVRLVLPVDFEVAYVLRSHNIIPAIQNFLARQIIDSGIKVGSILLTILAVGTAVFLTKDAVTILRFRNLRRNYGSVECAAVHKAADELGIKHTLIVTPCADVPHVAGHFRQVIYVPPLELSESDWKYVLMHEAQHISAHDQQIKLMFLLIRAMFWWNPIAHLFMRELDAILELRCDNAVTSRLCEDESLEYFAAMLAAIKLMLPRGSKRSSAASSLIGGQSESKSNVKQRFEVYLHSNKRCGRTVRNAIHILLILTLICSYFVIVQPAYFPPEEELIGADMTVENETSFILFDGNKYWLFVDNEKISAIEPEELNNLPYCELSIYGG